MTEPLDMTQEMQARLGVLTYENIVLVAQLRQCRDHMMALQARLEAYQLEAYQDASADVVDIEENGVVS